MRGRDVRDALRRKVLAEHLRDANTRVVEELGIAYGEVRVDVAVVNGLLHGFEIKSDADTLQRLPAQRDAYNAVFDRVTVVTGSKHLERIEVMVPEWWGIKLATSGERGAVNFDDVRRPRSNPSVQAEALAALLWREEAVAVLQARGRAGVSSKTRSQLYAIIAAEMPLGDVREAVRCALKVREGWRSDTQPVPCAG